MREKLLKLMKSEGLSSSRFAEILEIQPSSISHILSGRNKPSFDFLVKILKRFPNINPDWLLLDNPEIYRSNTDRNAVSNCNNENQSNDKAANFSDAIAQRDNNESTFRTTNNLFNQLSSAPKSISIERVIILYSDKSFEAFTLK